MTKTLQTMTPRPLTTTTTKNASGYWVPLQRPHSACCTLLHGRQVRICQATRYQGKA